MSYEQDAHNVARALTHIAHAFTRFATAHQRLADAAEESNRIARQELSTMTEGTTDYDSALAPIVLPAKGIENDDAPDV